MSSIPIIAPLIASAIAAIAFLSGLWQFRHTQLLTREVKAVELFLKFNELNQQIAESKRSEEHDAVFWRRNAMVAITEAVFNLTQGNKSWEATVRWMFEVQKEFLTRQPFAGDTFSPGFVRLLKEAIPEWKSE
jgi:hypothetical protein